MSEQEKKPNGYIHPVTGKIVIRWPQEHSRFRGSATQRAFINPEHHDEMVREFQKAKFFITRSGKFKARQAAGSYVENVRETKEGDIEFVPTSGCNGSAYIKGDWTQKFLSRKIIL